MYVYIYGYIKFYSRLTESYCVCTCTYIYIHIYMYDMYTHACMLTYKFTNHSNLYKYIEHSVNVIDCNIWDCM